jgi:hypothetical protein
MLNQFQANDAHDDQADEYDPEGGQALVEE